MGKDTINGELDRLAHLVDPVETEFRAWETRYGPVLDKIVKLAQAALADRPQFALRDTGNRGKARILVLTHQGANTVEIAVVALTTAGDQVFMQVTNPVGDRIIVGDDALPTTTIDQVDESWVESAVGGLLGRIE